MLSFMGLNDLHGRLRALPGFAGYVGNVRRAREADGGAVVLVDAGDMFQGTLESNLTEGASVITAYGVLGMSVATLGNHEFDFGPVGETTVGDPQGAIRARIAEAPFPILSANLVTKGSHGSPKWDRLRRSALLKVDGVRVGFVGLLTAETPSIVMGSAFVGLDVEPLAPALLTEAKALRAAGAELVVAVAHAGADCKDFSDPNNLSSCGADDEIFDVARAMPPGLVDAIFAGHSHTGIAHIVNGIPIVEAYAYGHSFSRIDLRLDGQTHRVLAVHVFPPHDLCPDLASGRCPLSEYEGHATLPDPALASAIAPALALAADRCQMPVGCALSEAFRGEHAEESPLGNLLADLTREAVPGSDIAIVNGGALRADLPAGPLEYGQLYEVIPFDNLIARMRMTGAELRAALAVHLTHNAHGLVSISGLKLSTRCAKTGLEITLTRSDGRLINDQDVLQVAMSDYLATGGDGLFNVLKLAPERVHVEAGRSFRDALVAALKRHPRLSPRDPAIFDPDHPRLSLITPRPVICLAH